MAEPAPEQTPEETPQERAARLRRAAELLGDLAPASSRDDTDEGWGESGSGGDGFRDAELRRNVPPHHG